MRIIRFGAGLAALVLSAHLLAAQEPTPPRRPDHRPGSMMGAPGMAAHQMQMMDSLNGRLDTLVSRMNAASGSGKVAAMADVINELVSQRKVMQNHMRQMMESWQGTNRMMGQPGPAGRRMPAPAIDSASRDSAGHADQKPPS